MRDREEWRENDHDRKRDDEERFESPTRRHRPHDPDEGYGMDEDDRIYEGDYPRADMGGPYRYGVGTGRRGPMRPRRGRRYESIGDYTGVGSAEGYSGFGGPGWQSGGYGDPGFGTSGARRRHHGADHSIGTDLAQDQMLPERARIGRGETAHSSRTYPHDAGYETGPHIGRGPKNYQRSDDRIREDVCDRLTRHGAIDASEIEIEVEGADVTLRGSVNGRQAKRLAEDVVEVTPGVSEVFNNLRSQRS